MAAHLSALVAAGLPFGHILGPLIVYLAKGHESEFVGEHARASLNYQITVSIAAVILVVVAIALAVVGGIAFGALDSSSQGRSEDVGPALGFVALWVVILGGVIVFAVVSTIFIILGTVAASDGKPYRYPFALEFIREPH